MSVVEPTYRQLQRRMAFGSRSCLSAARQDGHGGVPSRIGLYLCELDTGKRAKRRFEQSTTRFK